MQCLEMKWSVRIILFCVIVSGVHGAITIEQRPILVASLGQDATLLCYVNVSDDSVTNKPVLYWEFQRQEWENPITIWPQDGKYEERVTLLNQDPRSLNKSIRLKNVQWEDWGKYQCKVSVTTQRGGSFRKPGETELLIYDGVFFNTNGLNSDQLQCGASVSGHSGFTLSISYNNQTLNYTSGLNSTSELYLNLTLTITFRRHQKYQCSLTFNGTLYAVSVYQHHQLSEEEYPQPWFLYSGLILVQLVFLLVLTIALLMIRCL